MSWQLFTIIQFAAFAAAAMGALWLRNRRLARRGDELLALCASAHQALEALTERLTAMETTAPPEKMLGERIKALSGDDPLIKIRRLVLQNELEPTADFGDRIAEYLAPESPPDEEEFARRWRAIRQECHQFAMFLIADNPAAHEPIAQLFEVIAPLDEAYDIELPPLEVHPVDAAAADRDTGSGDAAAADAAIDGASGAAGTVTAGPGEQATAGAEPEADPSAGEDGSEELDQAALDALLEQNRKASAGMA